MRPRTLRLALAGVALLALGAIGCQSEDERKAEHLARAETYLAEGKHREAMLELRNALKLDPKSAEVNFRLADVAMRVESYGDALFYYEEAMRLDPERTDAPLAVAHLLLAEDPERAESLIGRVLEQDEDNLAARIRLTELLLARRQAHEARRTALEAVRLHPEEPVAHLNLGIVLRAIIRRDRIQDRETAEGMYQRALEVFDRAIELADDDSPETLRARVERARVLAEWKPGTEEVKAAFRDAIAAAKPWPAQEQAALAATLEYATVDRDPALRREVLERLVEIDPSDHATWVEMARLEQVEGRSADPVYERLVAQRPADGLARALYAQYLAGEGRAAEALAQLESGAEQADDPAVVWGSAVDLHLREGDLAEAASIVERMQARYGDSPHTQFAAARVALVSGRPADAAGILRRLVTRTPTVSVRRVLAQAELALGNREAALAALNDALADANAIERRDLLRLRAYVQAQLRDWEGVIATWREVARPLGGRLAPDDAIALSRAMREAGREDLARRQLVKLAERDDAPAAALVELARLDRRADPEAARARLETVLEREPMHGPALLMLVRMDLAAGRTDAALARIDAALERAPEAPGLHLLRARALAEQEDLPAATEAVRRALAIAPRYPGAAGLLVNLLASQDQLESATDELRQRAEAGTLDADGMVLLARLEMRQGREVEARRLFERALEARGDQPEVKNDLAFLLAKQGDSLDRALQLAEEAHAALPESPETLDTLGYVYLRRGVPEAAVARLQEAIELAEERDEVPPSFHYHLGLALRGVGRGDEAREAFERVIAADGASPEAEAARAELEALRSAS